VLQKIETRGDSRPRLSSGAKLRYLSGENPVELRSTGQPRAAVPTSVKFQKKHERDARAYIKLISNYRRRQFPPLRRQAVPADREQSHDHRRRRT
jgi:hypothetical protein